MDETSRLQAANRKIALTPTMRLQLRRMNSQARSKKRSVSDVETLHQRIAALNERLETQQDSVTILRQRAAELARPVNNLLTNDNGSALVVLKRGELEVALAVEYVREILPLENLTIIPGVPPFIVGVINARGKIITLVDIEVFLRQSSSRISGNSEQKQAVVLVEMDGFEYGLLSDGFPLINQHSVSGFSSVDNAILDYQAQFLKGISKEGVLWLDLAAVACSPEFLVNQE
ncbi:MAG TPA: chemotaxis protein CheW [Chloroflexia bacterium]|nr:chemotaxis protein CheW [Chloroflexia bacterium]